MKLVSISIVREDGYGASVGLRPQDLLYKLNGIPVENPQSINDALAKGPTRITIIRGDQIFDLSVNSPTLGVVLGEVQFDEEAWRAKQAVLNIALTTAHSFADKRILKTVDVVGAQCVYGVNALADFAAGIREFVGGRSQGLQNRIADARREVCHELRLAAHAIGGNAVIAVNFEHAEVGDKGGFMLMVTGTGTAVITE